MIDIFLFTLEHHLLCVCDIHTCLVVVFECLLMLHLLAMQIGRAKFSSICLKYKNEWFFFENRRNFHVIHKYISIISISKWFVSLLSYKLSNLYWILCDFYCICFHCYRVFLFFNSLHLKLHNKSISIVFIILNALCVLSVGCQKLIVFLIIFDGQT